MTTSGRAGKVISIPALAIAVICAIPLSIANDGLVVIWIGIAVVVLSAIGLFASLRECKVESCLWVWILLVILALGYLTKSFYFLFFESAGFYRPEFSWVDEAIVGSSMKAISMAFLFFSVASYGCLRALGLPRTVPVPKVEEGQAVDESLRRRCLGVLVLSLVLYVVGVFGVVVLRLPVMGQEAVHLPLRLDFIINRTIREVLPAVALTIVWLTDRWKSKLTWAAAVALFVGIHLCNAALSTSRGGAIIPLLALLILWIVSGRISRRRCWMVAGCLVVALALMPIITLLRASALVEGERVAGYVAAGRTDAVLESYGEWQVWANLLLTRITGAEGIWWLIREGQLPDLNIGLDVFWGGLAEVYTRDVVGIRLAGDYRAPGILGAFVMLVGWDLSSFAFGAYVFLVGVAWSQVRRLRNAPVASTLFALALITFTIEGTFRCQDILVTAGCMLVSRWFSTWLSAKPSFGRMVGSSMLMPKE